MATRRLIKQFPQLVGKTIAGAEIIGSEEYDDEDGLELTFTDGTFAYIYGGFGGYTGNSRDEYPAYVTVNYSTEDQGEEGEE